MALPPPSKDVLEHVRQEFGLDEQGIKEAVEIIKAWLYSQPHLPHSFDDNRLERWILQSKNSLERTKTSIDIYYALKNQMPEILMDRDMNSPWFENTSKIFYYMPLPKLRDDYSRVVVIGLLDLDPDKFIIDDVIKMELMGLEILMSEDYCASYVVIADFKCTFSHIAKVTLPALKKLITCSLKGFNMRLKEIHIINCPPFAQVLVNLIKSMLSEKIASRVHVYSNDLTALYDKVPKEILPKEYGGECDSIANLWSVWLKHMKSYRDWFMEQDKFVSDESKRPGGAMNSEELFGMVGSFRKLNVD